MKSTARLTLVAALLFGAMLLSATLANAYCPPGTHWSNRAGTCVGDHGYGHRPPPPPPPPPGRGCNGHYQRCLSMCGGVPSCVHNCNIGYTVCRQQRGR